MEMREEFQMARKLHWREPCCSDLHGKIWGIFHLVTHFLHNLVTTRCSFSIIQQHWIQKGPPPFSFGDIWWSNGRKGTTRRQQLMTSLFQNKQILRWSAINNAKRCNRCTVNLFTDIYCATVMPALLIKTRSCGWRITVDLIQLEELFMFFMCTTDE